MGNFLCNSSRPFLAELLGSTSPRSTASLFCIKSKNYLSVRKGVHSSESSKLNSIKYGLVLSCLLTKTLSFDTMHVASKSGQISLFS